MCYSVRARERERGGRKSIIHTPLNLHQLQGNLTKQKQINYADLRMTHPLIPLHFRFTTYYYLKIDFILLLRVKYYSFELCMRCALCFSKKIKAWQ